MVNEWLMKRRPVAAGYDPIPMDYAKRNGLGEWDNFDPTLVDFLEEKLGTLSGKRVLDLGAGAGQFAVEFARRGANVVWHDISRNYMTVAQSFAQAYGVDVEFSLGYMEEASKFADRPFDLVFNRICWYYCLDDRHFAELFNALIGEGGMGYIDNFLKPVKGLGSLRYWLNAATGIKIGNPSPPRGRLEKLFKRFGSLDVDLVSETPRNERILLTRAGAEKRMPVLESQRYKASA